MIFRQQSQGGRGGREALVGAVFCWIALGMGEAHATSPEETIAGAARKVVKLYGAGGVRGLEAYQTGILISAEGHVVTVMSTVLDADEIDCVLDDGRRYKATLTESIPVENSLCSGLKGKIYPHFRFKNRRK